MSHDSGVTTSHDSNVEMSCDTEKQYEVNYTQVYFDDTNTKR